MKFKVGEFVIVTFWDHKAALEEDAKPELLEAPGWISEINDHIPSYMTISHSRGVAENDLWFPFTVILKSEIVKIRKLK